MSVASSAASRETIGDFVPARVKQWESAGDISAGTADRYRELVRNQILPHLGAKRVQDLRPRDIETWHAILRGEGIGPRTIGSAHRILSKALGDAARNEDLVKNVALSKPAPKVTNEEMLIVKDVPASLEKLRTQKGQAYIPALIALFTGLRRGEILALRWSHIDLDAKTIAVDGSIEESKAHGLRVKSPKTKSGKRKVTLPDVLVEALRQYRKEQLELRMKIGTGRLPDDALLFTDINGAPVRPNALRGAWGRLAAAVDMPEVTFHAAPYPCFPTHRRGRRHRHHLQAPWSRQAGYYLARLLALV